METFLSVFRIASLYGDQSAPIPIQDRDTLKVPTGFFGDSEPGFLDKAAINFQKILRDGSFTIHTQSGLRLLSFIAGRDATTSLKGQSIDWNSEDSYTKALKKVEEQVLAEIEQSPQFRELLGKNFWTLEDRKIWEREVGDLVLENLHQIPGLSSYRYISEKYPETTHRPVVLNELAQDIDNNTDNVEFDCEEMSATAGSIIQRIENSLLPDDVEPGNLKVASNYFLFTGKASWDKYDSSVNHAYIVSSATGNIIEATSEPWKGNSMGSYIESTNPNHHFDNFAKTGYFVAKNGSVYMAGSPIPFLYPSLPTVHDHVRLLDGQYDDLFDNIDPKWTSLSEGGGFPESLRGLAEIKSRVLMYREQATEGSGLNVAANFERYGGQSYNNEFGIELKRLAKEGELHKLAKYIRDHSEINPIMPFEITSF